MGARLVRPVLRLHLLRCSAMIRTISFSLVSSHRHSSASYSRWLVEHNYVLNRAAYMYLSMVAQALWL